MKQWVENENYIYVKRTKKLEIKFGVLGVLVKEIKIKCRVSVSDYFYDLIPITWKIIKIPS